MDDPRRLVEYYIELQGSHSREGRVFANWRIEGHDAPTVRLDGEPWRKETR